MALASHTAKWSPLHILPVYFRFLFRPRPTVSAPTCVRPRINSWSASETKNGFRFVHRTENCKRMGSLAITPQLVAYIHEISIRTRIDRIPCRDTQTHTHSVYMPNAMVGHPCDSIFAETKCNVIPVNQILCARTTAGGREGTTILQDGAAKKKNKKHNRE